MLLKIDVNELMKIIGNQGVSFFGICSERKTKKIEEALIKNIGKWLSGISEEPEEITLDELIDRWGYNTAMNCVVIRKMDEAGLIKNHATFWVYDTYLKLCEGQNLTPEYNKITFSREICCKCLGYSIQDVHKDQHKYRVFRKLRKASKKSASSQDEIQD